MRRVMGLFYTIYRRSGGGSGIQGEGGPVGDAKTRKKEKQVGTKK